MVTPSGCSCLSIRSGLLPFRLVDSRKELIKFTLCARPLLLQKEVRPDVTAAQAHDKILLREPQFAQNVDRKRNQFRIGSRRCLADNVCVELKELAQRPRCCFS